MSSDSEHVPGEPIRNSTFAINGINHLALVCSDMDRTVEFYRDVLGMPLIKDITLPDGRSHHFFFGLGNGDSLAFFYFEGAPGPHPGIASAGSLPGGPNLTSAVGSMNHVAFDVSEDDIDRYRDMLTERGVEVSEFLNHDDSPMQVSREVHDGTFVRSIYFMDPDGILLEFAAWTNAGKYLASDQERGVAEPVTQ